MSLLNTKVPVLETYSTQNSQVKYMQLTQPTSGLAMLHSMTREVDLWYCMITTPASLEVNNLTDIIHEASDGTVYQQILDKKAVLVIDLPFEPFLNCIDSIYENVVKRCNIPASQVIFQSNLYDAASYNKEAAARHGCEPIRIIWFAALEFMMQAFARHSHRNVPSLAIKSYNKKFLNLNRRWRMHRPMLVMLMYYYDLLKSGHISFGPCEEHASWADVWGSMCVSAIGNQEMCTALEDTKERIKTLPPLYLDTDELHTNKAELNTSTDRFYQDSYFSVVSETTFYYKDAAINSRFITEKTFKAIAMKHPFILVTIPHSLAVLKELGYRTFSPWIDESYDHEMDDNKRMLMIIKEIQRLSNLSPDELSQFLSNVIPTCEHNFNILRTKKNFIYERLM